jgi:hypothetical protein
MRGVHAINDGGYHRWPETLDGPKPDDATTLVLGQFGKLSEAMRNDSECTFGIGKKRFRILRLPLLVSKKSSVDNIFRTCAILHNMLLQYDGLDAIGDFDNDYKDTTVEETTENLDVDTSGLPSDEWLNNDIAETDIRLRFSEEEQMRSSDSLTPITTTTDMLTHSIVEPTEPTRICGGI